MPNFLNLGAASLAAAALLLTGCGGAPDPSPEPPITMATSSGGSASPAATETAPVESSTPASVTPAAPTPSTLPTTPSGQLGEDVDLASHQFNKSAPAIISLVAEKTQGAVVNDLELDFSRYHGRWVYKVEAHDGTVEHELRIDAMTGEVLEQEQGFDDDTVQAIDPERLSPADAMQIAKLSVPGTVAGWQLEWSNGRQSYEVTIRAAGGEEEVYVDVETRAATQDR